MVQPLRHYLELTGRSAEQYRRIFDRARELRTLRARGERPETLRGKTLAFYFEKPSARTRVSFEAAAVELGARCVDVPAGANLFPRYTALADLAQMLSAYSDGVVFRTSAHDRVHTLAKAARVPVLNAASDASHPARTLSDVFAVYDRLASANAVTVAFVGDGTSVTAHSFIEAAALFGFALRVASPAGHAPVSAGDKVLVTKDPREAVREANVVVCDTWTAVQNEAQLTDRMQVFAGFQLDAALMKHAQHGAMVLHCLPPHRGREISADVYDRHASVARLEAESRLHVQKALLEDALLRPPMPGAELWPLLSNTEREAVTAALTSETDEWAKAVDAKSIAPREGAPKTEVLGARREGDTLFVLASTEHSLWYTALSGSDWGEHHMRVIEAAFERGARRSQRTLGERSVKLSEYECLYAPEGERYDPASATRAYVDTVLFEQGLR